MVPAAAFAEAAADDTTDAGLELLTNATDDELFTQGVVTSAVAVADGTTDVPAGTETALTVTDGVVHISAASTNKDVVPTVITDQAGKKIEVYKNDDDDFGIGYFQAGSDGAITSTGADATYRAGHDYWVTVTPKVSNAYDLGTSAKFSFKVVVDAVDISTAKLFDDSNAKADFTDTTFTYNINGAAQAVGIVLGEDEITDSTDYDVKIYKSDKTLQGTNLQNVVDAGTYTVVITGKGNTLTGEATVEFTIDKLVLSADNVKFVTGAPASATEQSRGADADDVVATGVSASGKFGIAVGGTAVTGATTLAVELKSDPLGYKELSNGPGVFTFTVAPATAAKDNIDGSVDLAFTEVGDMSATQDGYIKYDAKTWSGAASDAFGAAGTASYVIDTKTGLAFDASKITVNNGTKDLDYILTITDADDNKVEASALTTTPGVYTVTVEIDDAKCDYAYYGKQTATITVTQADLSAYKPLVTFDGETITNAQPGNVDYNGKDMMDLLDIVVKSGDTELAAGTDYKVYVKQGTTTLDEAKVIDASTTAYDVYIQSDAYMISETKVATITVNALVLKDTKWKFTNPGDDTIRVAEATDPDEDGTYDTIAWDGKDIVPTFQYFVEEGEDEEPVFETLDASLYTLTLTTGGKKVDAINGAGTYTYKLEATDADGADNFVWTDASVTAGTITVVANQYKITDASVKIDGNDKTMGSVTGIAAAAVDVASEQSFTAKAADGYKIANVSITADGEDVEYTEKDGEYTFTMPAADVTVNVEFAVAGFNDTKGSVFEDVINTAAKAGLVHGYADGSFRPNKTITRAEVATILYNAAVKTSHKDETSQAGDNDTNWNTGFDDVSGSYWAAEYIAWAKAAGVVNGNGGKFRPNDTVTRQEFAAMLANYAKNVVGEMSDGDAPVSRVKDMDKVASWAKEVVTWAVTNEIMGNGGAVNPTATATRGEVTAMLVNYLYAE